MWTSENFEARQLLHNYKKYRTHIIGYASSAVISISDWAKASNAAICSCLSTNETTNNVCVKILVTHKNQDKFHPKFWHELWNSDLRWLTWILTHKFNSFYAEFWTACMVHELRGRMLPWSPLASWEVLWLQRYLQ